MTHVASWMQRWQVVLSLAAITAAAGFALLAPAPATATAPAITPALALLLYATFLAVPFPRVLGAFRDRRFLATILVVNFVVAPVVAFGVTRFLTADVGVLVGALIVLLTPCIDYVVVFAGLAGGSRERLLAATPLLMTAQTILLPVFLWIMAGSEIAITLDPWPFVHAFLLLIALPLGAAILTQLAARRSTSVARISQVFDLLMVPLMMAVLAIVVASQLPGIMGRLTSVITAVPVFVAFAIIMTIVGIIASRAGGLDAGGSVSVLFSGVTRNSLVVLPLTLALPPAYAVAPLVVVTQTIVELLVMVALVSSARMLRRPG